MYICTVDPSKILHQFKQCSNCNSLHHLFLQKCNGMFFWLCPTDSYSSYPYLSRFLCILFSRWWFQISFYVHPYWGRFPIWLIFFRWVESTNQFCFLKRSQLDALPGVAVVLWHGALSVHPHATGTKHDQGKAKAILSSHSKSTIQVCIKGDLCESMPKPQCPPFPRNSKLCWRIATVATIILLIGPYWLATKIWRGSPVPNWLAALPAQTKMNDMNGYLIVLCYCQCWNFWCWWKRINHNDIELIGFISMPKNINKINGLQ